jgi:hypothetical protein
MPSRQPYGSHNAQSALLTTTLGGTGQQPAQTLGRDIHGRSLALPFTYTSMSSVGLGRTPAIPTKTLPAVFKLRRAGFEPMTSGFLRSHVISPP